MSLTPVVGDRLPRRGNLVTRAIARLMMRVSGWRFEGALPNLEQFVLIVAPHTSNWDFPVGIMAMFALDVRATFLGKDTLFNGPFGFIFRWMGGVPVDRRSPHNVVEQTVEYFKRRDRMILALSPEGTRRKIPRWRTGFYWVAVGAGVPIVPVALDFSRKRYIIHPPRLMTGHAEQDIAALQTLFRADQARRPELY
ncbi:MAG TPA: lysophospholipid acyltransferase family protein [Longimicrobiales bacterium]|nr:lysophospholipid acyltransferase family protein [Longimicrobiales bacterium]